MKTMIACALLCVALAGCETSNFHERAHARYEKIQPEVDAYYYCGQKQAYGLATTALRPRDIATGAKGACKRTRHRMLAKMQRCYPSATWSKLTIDIEQTFRERAIAVVFDRRADLGIRTPPLW